MAGQDKRGQIMRAAEKLFAARRFHEVTLDDVVREAHVGKGTVYRYFRDKEDLFFQVAVSGFDELCSMLEERVVAQASFEEQLLQAACAVTAFFTRRRRLFGMIQHEEARMSLSRGRIRGRWMERRGELVAALARIMELGAREGVLRDDLDAGVLAHLFLGLLRTRARDIRGQGLELEDGAVVDFFLQGARRPVTVDSGAADCAAGERTGA